jgi:nucleotide-binding universal stress UspA family protein
MFNRILVPLDCSTIAEQALPHAASLARAFNPEIFLVGVWESGEAASEESCSLYIQKEAQLLRQELRGQAKEVRQFTREGGAAEKILKYALEQEADLIVVPSHGRSGASRWPPSSTVNRALHDRVSVLVVHAKDNVPPIRDLFSRVLVPLDGSDDSAAVIAPLVNVSQKIPSGMTLLMVVEKEHRVRTVGGLNYIPYLDEDLDARKKTAADYLSKVAAQLEGGRASVKTEVRVGSPAEEILKLASGMDATLIALASHVHSALETWFYGSVTQKIIQDAGRSLLLVPTKKSG